MAQNVSAPSRCSQRLRLALQILSICLHPGLVSGLLIALCPLVAFGEGGSELLAHSLTGTVERVIDGDTVVVTLTSHSPRSTAHAPQSLRIRLAEIDAPEKKQPGGHAATQALSDLVTGKVLVIHYTKRDRYGRILGTIYVDAMNVNRELVAAGYAWRYRYARKTGQIAKAEQQARQNHRGLWSTTSPTPPWVFRRR
jgi:endonuclease YncB( thermonuclease family)